MKSKKESIREQAENDLLSCIRLIHKGRVLGQCHEDVIRFWEKEDRKSHQLVLLPRDHQKSALVAYWAVQQILRNPAVRILYISSTSNLAEKQLKFIKDILTSDVVRFYWPELINVDEGKREKWTSSEISVDHPLRKAEFIRDPTIFTAGLTTAIVGLHCDIQILDDVVTDHNAYTEEGREKVRQQYSLLSSIAGADAIQKVVGTRYHPKDLYGEMLKMQVEIYDDEGELESDEFLYEKREEVVEDRGDGTGQYLWPRQQRYDGKWFGFDQKILAKKKAQYLDQSLFRAQYYNDPNDYEGSGIAAECFQYYDRAFLKQTGGYWYYKDARLNLCAAVDFAFSLRADSDFSAIVVVGVDPVGNYYVLDIDRFKTKMISEYYKHLFNLYRKWDFRKLIAEVTQAQEVIVQDLKHNYIYRDGLGLVVEDFRPNRNQGNKEERTNAILQPRYNNRQIFHYRTGNCQVLEEELVVKRPPHDDCKDALATAIEHVRAPTSFMRRLAPIKASVMAHTRFGGIS